MDSKLKSQTIEQALLRMVSEDLLLIANQVQVSEESLNYLIHKTENLLSAKALVQSKEVDILRLNLDAVKQTNENIISYLAKESDERSKKMNILISLSGLALIFGFFNFISSII